MELLANKYKKAILLFITLTGMLLLTAMSTLKVDFHLDELFTFGLANQQVDSKTVPLANDSFLPLNQKIKGKDILTSYTSVDKSHKFDFSNVWYNQSKDVHPPLYYAFIHTISSIFPNKFSKWFGLSINILIFGLTIIAMYGLMNYLNIKKTTNFMIVFYFAVSAGVLNASLFLRMYALATLLVTVVSFLHVKYFKVRNVSFYIWLYVISLLGALTHYYFLVYLFFICLFYSIHLLLNKDYKSLFKYIFTEILAGLSMVIVFPAVFQHVFSSNRGEESLANAAHFNDYASNIVNFIRLVLHTCFGNATVFVLLFLFSCLVYSCYYFFIKKSMPVFNQKYFMILITAVLYFFVVSKIAVYLDTDRYFYPIYPVIIICSLSLIFELVSTILRMRVAIIINLVLSLVLLSIGYATNPFEYLYRSALPGIELSKSHNNEDALFVSTAIHTYLPSAVELENYKSVTLSTVNDINKNEILYQDSTIVLYVGIKDANMNKAVCEKVKSVGNFVKATQLYHYSYSTVYLLEK